MVDLAVVACTGSYPPLWGQSTVLEQRIKLEDTLDPLQHFNFVHFAGRVPLFFNRLGRDKRQVRINVYQTWRIFSCVMSRAVTIHGM